MLLSEHHTQRNDKWRLYLMDVDFLPEETLATVI